MSCEGVAKVLYLDDDPTRGWHRLYQEDGIEGLGSFGYESLPRRRPCEGRGWGVPADGGATGPVDRLDDRDADTDDP